jgi:hypothetical protein
MRNPRLLGNVLEGMVLGHSMRGELQEDKRVEGEGHWGRERKGTAA